MQAVNSGEGGGRLDTLRQLAAEEVARQMDFRTDGPGGAVGGDSHLYHAAVTDPWSADALRTGRSFAVKRFRDGARKARNDDNWFHNADKTLGYRRPFDHKPQLKDYERMRYVAEDDETMEKFVALGGQRAYQRTPPSTPLAHLLFPEERLRVGRPAAYPPAFDKFFQERMGHDHRFDNRYPLDTNFKLLQLQRHYSMNVPQAQVALQEIYQEFLAAQRRA